MAWTQRLLDELLAARRQPRFVVDSLRGFGLPSEGTAVRWSTHAEGGYEQVITRDGTSIQHASLSPGSWTVSPSSLNLGLTRVDVSRLRPGLVLQLRLGFEGWDVGDYEPVWTGMLVGLSYAGRRYQARLKGLEGSLNARWGIGAPYPVQPAVFFDLADATSHTTLATAFTPGISTELDFNTSNEPQRATGGLYTVRITNNAGTQFLVQGDTLTSFSAGTKRRLSGLVYGVMDGAAPSGAFSVGNDVEYLAWDEEHPLRIAQRLVTSTGNGTNGAEDVYPAEWGLGVPASVVDADDWSAQRVFAGPLGLSSPSWHMLQGAPATTFGQWLASFLGDGGFWVCQRQGLLTGRGIQALESQAITMYPSDRDLMSVDIEHFGGQVEYGAIRVVDHGQRSASTPNPYDPAVQLEDTVARLVGAIRPKLPPVVGPDYLDNGIPRPRWGRPIIPEFNVVLPVYGATGDRSAWLVDVVTRLEPYVCRRPEVITATMAGLHWGRATLGDAVGLTTAMVHSRRGPTDLVTKGGWHTVVGGGPDWFRGTTTLQLWGVPPTDEG